MPFLIVVPNQPLIAPTSLIAINETTHMVALNNPQEISEICIALTAPIADANLGVGIFFGFPPNVDYEFLGVLTNHRPSALLSTGWPWSLAASGHSVVNLYLTIEPAEQLLEKLKCKPICDIRQELARKTALNLFRFVESFTQTSPRALIEDPCTLLDLWYKRYEEKLTKDRNFVLSTE